MESDAYASIIKFQCMTCQSERKKNDFSRDQWEKVSCELKLSGRLGDNTDTRDDTVITCIICRICVAQKELAPPPEPLEKICSICSIVKERADYSKKQWKHSDSERNCRSCSSSRATAPAAKNPYASSNITMTRECSMCSIFKGKTEFSNSQWTKNRTSERTCRPCVQISLHRTKHKLVIHDQSKTSNFLGVDQSAKVFDLTCYKYVPISLEDETRMLEQVIEDGYYGEFPESQSSLQNLELYLDSSQTDMTMSQAISLRSHHLMEKAMCGHYKLKMNSQKLLQQYNTGISIVQLAKILDLPPLNVLRHILGEMKYNKDKIKKSFKNPDQYLPLRERREFHEASSVDIIASADDNDRLLRSQSFEQEVDTYLRQNGLTFRTEAELKKMGVCYATPDVLLQDPLVINGTRIHWIDAKCFYGSNVANIVSGLRKQKNKYMERWGVGAFIFLHGF